MYNVISDIAGQFNTLKALIAKMPEGKVLSVGDMIDRGPRSKEVVDFFMNGGGEALKGNHEHFVLNEYLYDHKYYDHGVWEWNGGDATLASYGYQVPMSVVNWMDRLPTYKEIDINGDLFFVSHAFVRWDAGGLDNDIKPLLWNRKEPVPNEKYKLQICGHNSQFGLRWWGNPAHSVCIDSSRNRVLTGIHLPSMTIYQQEYID